MLKIGKYNTLKVVKSVDFGVFLSDGNDIEVLLPSRYIEKPLQIGTEIEVFVYRDSEDRLIATTERPLTHVEKFAILEVNSVNKVGAFLNWGLPKDLLVPFNEQSSKMKEGGWYLVYTYLDDATQRIVASSKINKFLGNTIPNYSIMERVSCLVYEEAAIGYKVIVNNLHKGIVYKNEIYNPISIGSEIFGYVKKIRDDGKLDVSLSDVTVNRIESLASRYMQYINENGGETTLGDKSSPEEIKSIMACSKKDLKKAIGLLYKQRRIQINGERIIAIG